ncbi:alpha/beta fold hydrolase [Streptomyces ochraceiscleroticus]|uniref:Alpha/beta fold hydrolase n=1 Tax=Streptomyces ochraceiscleroticus TaxID=47761 RepID=A0ABW1MSF0_9ACTN|nr:alpha/beta fold hydrolase [Streptomyces ochraceiscleroticus]
MISPTSDVVFVLVHGAWHSSWHWALTQRSLAHLGAASVALDLPGHGFDAPLPSGYLLPGQPGLATEKSRLAGLTTEECAESILSTLREVRRHHRTVVLVSHSAGGGPASLAAQTAPDLVDRIVYLSAFVPAGRPCFTDYLSSPEQTATVRGQGLGIGDPESLGAFRINPVSTDPAYVEELRRTYYDDVPAEEFARWHLTLSPDLPSAIPTTPVHLTADRWGRIPRTFIRLADDRAATSAMQNLMITEADAFASENPFTVHELPGSHSPFAARPAELAAMLVSDLH